MTQLNKQVNRYLCETGTAVNTDNQALTFDPCCLSPLPTYCNPHQTEHVLLSLFVPILNLCTEDCRQSQQRAELHSWPEQVTDDQASI